MRSISTRTAGLLILILGLWGGLVPFVGPYFHYSLGPNHAWTWTMGRLWLDVLPAIAAVLGGLMLMGAGPRPHARLGALLALAGGIWFAIGPEISQLWTVGGAQGLGHGSAHLRMLEMLGYHTGLGVVVTALAAYALPRFPVVAAAGVPAAAAGGAAYGATAGERRVARERAAERDAAARTAPAGAPGAPVGAGTAAGVGGAAAAGSAVAAERERERERNFAEEPVTGRSTAPVGTGAPAAGAPATGVPATGAPTTAAHTAAAPAAGAPATAAPVAGGPQSARTGEPVTTAGATGRPATTATTTGEPATTTGEPATTTGEPATTTGEPATTVGAQPASGRALDDRGGMYGGYSGGVRRRGRGGLLSVFSRH